MSSADAAVRLPLPEMDFEDDALLEDAGAQQSPQPRTLPALTERNRVFTDFVSFEGVTFTGPVTFRGCRFQGGVSFKNARFTAPVTFSSTIVAALKGNRTIFDGATFMQSVKFNKSSSLYMASFTATEFNGPAEFRTRFYASARFEKAKFAQPANFTKAVFSGQALFIESEFKSTAEFSEVEFRYRHSHARFNRTAFSQFASFDDGRFRGHTDFSEAQFLGGANFHGAEFSLPFADADTTDNGEGTSPTETNQGDLTVSFRDALFQPDPDGVLVSFEEAKFGDQNFRRNISFHGARFRIGKQGLDPCTVDFKGAEFNGNATFQGAELGPLVTFNCSHTHFENDVDFSDAAFSHEAYFEKAKFSGSIQLAGTLFSRVPDFRQAVFAHYPQLYQCDLPDKIDRSARADRKSVIPRIGALRRIAARTDDKRTENALLVQELKLDGGVATRFYGLLAKYGQSWFRPALWLALSALIVFPGFHLLASGAYPRSPDQVRHVIATGGPPCLHGEGSALAAALELSMKNALIVGADNEIRSKRILECLGAAGPAGTRTIIGSILETVQTLVTLVLVFFIGAAVRRRLQLR